MQASPTKTPTAESVDKPGSAPAVEVHVTNVQAVLNATKSLSSHLYLLGG